MGKVLSLFSCYLLLGSGGFLNFLGPSGSLSHPELLKVKHAKVFCFFFWQEQEGSKGLWRP